MHEDPVGVLRQTGLPPVKADSASAVNPPTPASEDAKKTGSQSKPRALKTPLQKEALEAAFKINQFPPEAVRRALGDSIGLTDQQVQVWFSHKRRKVKADVATLPGPAAAPAAVGPEPPVMPAGEGGQAPAGLGQQAQQPQHNPAGLSAAAAAAAAAVAASRPGAGTAGQGQPAFSPPAVAPSGPQSTQPHAPPQAAGRPYQAFPQQTPTQQQLAAILMAAADKGRDPAASGGAQPQPLVQQPAQQAQQLGAAQRPVGNGGLAALSQLTAQQNALQAAVLGQPGAGSAAIISLLQSQMQQQQHQQQQAQQPQQQQVMSGQQPSALAAIAQTAAGAASPYSAGFSGQHGAPAGAAGTPRPTLTPATAAAQHAQQRQPLLHEQQSAGKPPGAGLARTVTPPLHTPQAGQPPAAQQQQAVRALSAMPVAYPQQQPAGQMAVQRPIYHHAPNGSAYVQPGPHLSVAAAQPRLPSSVPAAPTEYYADDGSDDDDSPEAQAAWQAELRELLEAAKRALLVPYREDGPQLAFEFDDIDPNQPQRSHNKRKRVAVDNGYEMGEDGVMRKRFAGGMGNVMTAHARPPMYGNQIAMTPEQRARYDAEQKALRDLERSQQLQRRLEMSMRKDLEKAEKDRRRNMEKMERDKKREEERQLKEAERLRQLAEREAKKAELAAEKESRAEERRRQMELKRQEKEMLKALQQQEKQAIRLRQRDGGAGPKDDLDIEWETLLEMRRASGYGSDSGAMTPALDPGSLARPEFPPAHLGLVKAFPQQLGDATGGDLLMVWNFIHSFSDILGLWPCTVEELVTAVVDGEKSRLLGEIHVGLLRLLQADMEESHATGATQGGGGPLNFMDRAVVHCASMLEEAWAWGFDVDVWRAHLNPLTWPEVLREFAIATGCGRKRPKAKKEARPKLGTEGEDIVADEGGGLKLRLPVRFGPGTVKAAAWQVLAEAGTSGLTISEIARRIQRSGLRDLRSSKTPEASVAAALSRDVIFCRLAPATYALQALICHNKLGQGAAGTGTSDENRKKENGAKSHTKPAAVKAEPGDTSAAGSPEGAAVKAEGGSTPAVKHEQNGEARQHDEEDDEDNSDDEAEEEASEAEGAGQGEAWVHALQQGDYGALTLEQRCAVLVTLVHNAIDGPSVRACLDGRLEEAQRIRKQMWEEARLEKRRRQAEAAAKAKLAADEAQKVLERLQNPHGDASPSGTSTPVDNVIGPPAAGGPGGQAAHGAAAQDPVHMAAAAIAAAAAQHQHHGEHDDLSAAAASRERQQQRAETIRRAEEANAVRGEPLGMDRRYNRYWRFLAGGEAGRDGGAGRIFVETYDEGTFRVLGEASALEGLMDALDRRGAREGALYNALLRHRESIMRGMPSQPIGMPAPLGERPEAEQQRVEAEHAAWIWSAATQASAISRAEAGAGPQQRYREGDSLRVTKLKAEMLRVAGALPKEAVQDIWNLASWTAGVKAAASVVELRSALGELEGAIREDYLSKLLQRQPLLVRGAWLPIGNEVASALPGTNGEVQQLPGRASRAATPERSAAVAAAAETLAWLPATVAAIALRLWALDAALVYKPGEHPARDSLQAYKYIQRPALPMNADDLQGVGRLEAEALQRMEAGGPRTVSGQPIGVGGRARPSIFPPFPQAILQAAQREFVLPVNEFRRALDPNAPPEPAPTTTAPQISQPARPAAPASRAPAGSKGRGKPRGKAVTVKKAGWRGASVASGVELDSSNINTGSHMEAATDDESDVDGPAEGPVGRRQRPTILDEDEDLEISD